MPRSWRAPAAVLFILAMSCLPPSRLHQAADAVALMHRLFYIANAVAVAGGVHRHAAIGEHPQHAVVGLCADRQHDRICRAALFGATGVLPYHLVGRDRPHARLPVQRAMPFHRVEHLPAAHDRQFAARLVALFQDRDLASARQQEFGQHKPEQPAANNYDLLPDRHPQLRQRFQGIGTLGYPDQAAGLEHGALGQAELGARDLVGAVASHQAAQFVAAPDVLLVCAVKGGRGTPGAAGYHNDVRLELPDQLQGHWLRQADLDRQLLHLADQVVEQRAVFGIGQGGEEQRATQARAALDEGDPMAAW